MPLDAEGLRDLLQQRISLFARVEIVMGVIIQVLVRFVAVAGVGALGADMTRTGNVHLLVLASLFVVSWRTRSGRRSEAELALLDVLCVIIPVGLAAVTLWFAAESMLRPDLIQVLGFANILLLRAVLLPSTGLRTAVLGTVIGGGLSAWAYAFYARFGTHDVATPAIHAAAIASWCSISVVISTLASHTLFGLRQRVRETAQLGQYTLLRRIGEGGMGVVYEARHALLRRRTALKMLPAAKAGEHDIVRFEREVQLTAKLTHPNTIAIYDYGRSPSGVFYYVMEYLDGVDLQAFVERYGPQPPELVAHVLSQVCSALAEAHAIGLIHRDIKPANVILCRRGGVSCVAKVVDFGLVRSLTPATGDGASSVADVVVGTPLYMSPESIAAPDRVDARSDLYAVGATGYFLLAGVAPFTGSSAVEVAAHHLHSVPPSPSERVGETIAPDLERLLLQCLEKEPTRRPDSAGELAALLRATVPGGSLSPELAESIWEKCSALARERESVLTARPDGRLPTVELEPRGL